MNLERNCASGAKNIHKVHDGIRAVYDYMTMCAIVTCTTKANDAAPPPSNLTHNCSFIQHGVCLHDAYPILRSFSTVDLGECCGNCTADPACVSWNINTGMKACFLRGSFRPNPGAECTSGCLRGACGEYITFSDFL